MIHQNLIKRRADEDCLSAPAVERDYVLAHVLAAISEHDRQARIVFKGGTALRLCYLEEYRYSADLDFSLIGGLDVESALRLVVDALADCRERLGFPLLGLTGSTVDAETIWPLFERKARHRDRDPDRFGDYFADRELRWGERWDKELAEYVTSPPHFDGVLRAVRRELRFALVS